MPLTREQEELLIRYLQTMKTLIYSEECAKIVAEVQEKDVVIFIGNTRAGKSTVVNYVIGNKLKATKIKKNNYKIKKYSEQDPGPKIGLEATSETTIPTAWNSMKINGLIVDAPGFDDNRGVPQDVANSFYIKEIITNANSVKFVLITDVNDITCDNIGQFINFVDKIHTILPQCDRLMSGMVVVFNKDKDETTVDEIKDCLRDKIINQPKIEIKSHSLVNFLLRNPNHFVICPTPKKEGEVCDDIFNGIDIAIEHQANVLPKMLLSEVTPGISHKSKCFLVEAHNYFTEFNELEDLLSKIQKEFRATVLPTDIHRMTDRDEMKTLKISLLDAEENLRKLINSECTIKESLMAMGKYFPYISDLQEGGAVYIKLDFIKFVDEILGIEESNIFRIKVTTALSKMKDDVTSCQIKLQEKMFEITSENAEKRFHELELRQKQDQIDFLKQINEMQAKQIEMLNSLKQESKSESGCSIM